MTAYLPIIPRSSRTKRHFFPTCPAARIQAYESSANLCTQPQTRSKCCKIGTFHKAHSLVTVVSGKIVSEVAMEAERVSKSTLHCQLAVFVVQGASHAWA